MARLVTVAEGHASHGSPNALFEGSTLLPSTTRCAYCRTHDVSPPARKNTCVHIRYADARNLPIEVVVRAVRPTDVHKEKLSEQARVMREESARLDAEHAAEVTRLALAASCPRCGVEAGRPCENLTKRRHGNSAPTKRPHPSRLDTVIPSPELEAIVEQMRVLRSRRQELAAQDERLEQALRIRSNLGLGTDLYTVRTVAGVPEGVPEHYYFAPRGPEFR